MNIRHLVRILTLNGIALAGLAAVATPAFSASVTDPDLLKVIAHGKDLFQHNTFQGNGRVCETCHVNGGESAGHLPNGKPIPSLANAAAVFPRFNKRHGKVVTLSDQVQNCIGGALEGQAPDQGSDDLTALVTYVTSLSQGKTIDMGGSPR